MAEDQENRSREDLTEEASPHRIEEYRQKGMVAQSREIPGLAVLLAASVTAYALAPSSGTQITDFMKEVFRTDLSSRVDLASPKIAATYMVKTLKLIISIGLPICGAGFVMGVIGTVAQIGPLFSWEPIMPDFSKINPLQGIQRMLSLKQIVEAARLIVKMSIVLIITYRVIKTEIMISPNHMGEDVGYLLQTLARISKSVFLSLIFVLGVFAAIDYGLQWMEHNKSVRMTKQEAKQEHKEREGDPQIRARIRAAQREMARKRMRQAVKKADVIITNPTHISIALVYDKSAMAAPKVVAKGADFVAMKIREIAKEAGVPMVENVPLARTLYKSVKVGQYIPRALYQAVAEVLAYVYRLKSRNT